MPSAAPILALICRTVGQLQALAPLVMALVLAAMLTLAIAFRGPTLTVSLIVTVVVAMIIMNLPTMVGALGAPVVCRGG